MPDSGGPPRKQFAKKRKHKKRDEYGPVKVEPSDSDYQARHTNPWRVSAWGSHDTINWLPRYMVPYLPQ